MFVENIVIADDYGRVLRFFQFLSYLLLIPLSSVTSLVPDPQHVIADTDRALQNKVHLLHLVLFVIYNPVFISGFKLPRHKSECYIVQESGIGVQVDLLSDAGVISPEVKEASEPKEDIFK
jgi:hypothetical protein